MRAPTAESKPVYQTCKNHGILYYTKDKVKETCITQIYLHLYYTEVDITRKEKRDDEANVYEQQSDKGAQATWIQEVSLNQGPKQLKLIFCHNCIFSQLIVHLFQRKVFVYSISK